MPREQPVGARSLERVEKSEVDGGRPPCGPSPHSPWNPSSQVSGPKQQGAVRRELPCTDTRRVLGGMVSQATRERGEGVKVGRWAWGGGWGSATHQVHSHSTQEGERSLQQPQHVLPARCRPKVRWQQRAGIREERPLAACTGGNDCCSVIGVGEGNVGVHATVCVCVCVCDEGTAGSDTSLNGAASCIPACPHPNTNPPPLTRRGP
jgi:hypothetical protein